MAERIDGQLIDIPPAVRIYREHSHAERMSAVRLNRRRRWRDGRVYWAHPLVPHVAFPTRKAALQAALGTLQGGASDAE